MMLRKLSIKNVLVVLGVAAMSLSANAGNLNLSQGTLTAGGNIGFTASKASGAPFADMQYGFGGEANFGYFVMDHWEVRALAGLNLAFNQLNTQTNVKEFVFNNVYFGVGTNYYFDLDSSIYPYIGLDVFGSAATAFSPAIWSIGVSPRVGMLIGLNCDVALDVGFTADLSWDLNGAYASGNPAIDAKLGYFGVKGFF